MDAIREADASDSTNFKQAHQSLVAKCPKVLQDLLAKLVSQKMSTSQLLYEVKQYASKIMKNMRDGLSEVQQRHVKETNTVIMDFEEEGL